MSRRNRPVTKDMYWFAHGGSEAMMNSNLVEEENEPNSLDRKGCAEEQKPSSKDISLTDGSNSSGPPSLERDDRLHAADKRTAVEERRKFLLEAEQERNDAVMRKHMEREAALEARRNAQRSTIAFAFGSSVPRNVDTLQSHHSVEVDCMSRSFTAASSSHRAELHNYLYDRRSISPIYSGGPSMVNGTSHQPDSALSTYSEKISNTQSGCLVGSGAIIVEDVMSKSMTASISAPRGRRKNDLMPTVPYDRAAAPRVATSSSSRRRSVSMTRLDQLAQPRKHYVEATKANSTASSGTSSLLKDVCSPNRPLSSASEHSGGRAASNVTRRVRSSPRKPRPVSIAGTIPDQRHTTAHKLPDIKGSATKKTPLKKTDVADLKKAPSTTKNSTPKTAEKPKSAVRPTTAPAKPITPKSSAPKPTPPPKTVAAKPKTPLVKDKLPSVANSAKPQTSKAPSLNKKKSDTQISAAKSEDVKVDKTEKSGSPLPDSDSGLESDKNNKRIISEEEAKAALAEKRRLAREQAEREAELERQKQEELRLQEEERLRKEEEDQRKMEEESFRLLEEHRRQEEEKLRKAIEDQEQKKEEERARQEEELRLKAEQDRKAKEESEKVRLELEEKLRREEEERAERKKRLEKIMSRTRGKSSGTSPSGSVSGSDHMDSGENQQEGFSSGANSLESNEGPNSPSEPVSSDDAMAKMEVSSSGGNSLEANLTYEFSSNDVSLNSNDLMLPASEIASQENSMIIAPNKESSHQESSEHEESNSIVTPVNVSAEFESNDDQTEDTATPSALEEAKISTEIDSVSQNAEELEIPAINEAEPAGQLEEALAFDNSEKPNLFEHSNELVKEQYVNETSGLHNDFENFKATLEENASPLDSQLIPSDHQDNTSSEYQDSSMLTAATGETSAAIESNPDQSFDVSRDPYSDSFVQEQMPVPDDKREDPDFIEQPREIGENVIISSKKNEYLEEKEIPKSSYEVSMGAGLSIAEEQTEFLEGNSFGVSSENENRNLDVVDDAEAAHSKHLHSSFLASFDGVEDASEAFKTAAGMDVSVDNPFVSNFDGGDDASEAFNSEKNASRLDDPKDNPFISNFDGAGDASEAFNSEKTVAGMDESKDGPFVSNFDGVGDASEAFSSEKATAGANVSLDNPFVNNYVSSETTNEQNIFSSQFGDSKEPTFLVPEHAGFEDQNLDKSSNLDLEGESDNVTLIKQEGSEKYVGIISSIDNDHFSNSFPKLNEHLTNNLECASTTDDSEDSSLDSNLSQVVAPEDVEKDLNNHTNSSDHPTSNNTDNPFMTQNHQNQSSIPQLGVDHYSEFEVYSNGHSTMESSKMVTDYGNSILSVENNIFENVGAIDLGKISSDPFLGKGSSNQISGNPFLMQEEQNPKVLMTSDFLN